MLCMGVQPSTGDLSDSEPGDPELVDTRQGGDNRPQVLTSWLVLVILALVVIVGLVLLAVRGAG